MYILKLLFELILCLISWVAIFFSTTIAGLASLNYLKTVNPIPEIASYIFTIFVFATAANISALICRKLYFNEIKEK